MQLDDSRMNIKYIECSTSITQATLQQSWLLLSQSTYQDQTLHRRRHCTRSRSLVVGWRRQQRQEYHWTTITQQSAQHNHTMTTTTDWRAVIKVHHTQLTLTSHLISYHTGIITKPPRPTQPPTLSGMGNEYQPKCNGGVCLLSKDRCQSFHTCVSGCVLGAVNYVMPC